MKTHSSTVFCGISPAQLYRDQGVAAHDFAVGAMTGALTDYLCDIVFATQSPRYVLLDAEGRETPFSHAEGEVLRLFLESPNRLISRAQMQETLGGAAGESFDRAMDVRISRLRTKLGEDPKNPKLIKTIYGAGYIFLGEVRWE